MSRLLSLLMLLAGSLMAAPARSAGWPVAEIKPDVDELLKDAGLPTDFWHKEGMRYGTTEDGWETWIVTADDAPKRMDDGECATRDLTWTIAIDPKTGHGILYSDEAAPKNPEAGFLLNMDATKREVPCDKIDIRDYFSVGEGIMPHEAVMLVRELSDAVGCVKRGETRCGGWKKIGVASQRDNFLRLPALRLFGIQWEDNDEHDWIQIQYLLSPISPDKRPYFDLLDCLVKTSPDGSRELDVTEGYIE